MARRRPVVLLCLVGVALLCLAGIWYAVTPSPAEVLPSAEVSSHPPRARPPHLVATPGPPSPDPTPPAVGHKEQLELLGEADPDAPVPTEAPRPTEHLVTEAPATPRPTARPTADPDDQWPSEGERRSFMWVFVYCAGQSGAQFAPQGTTSMAALFTAALELDFRVLVCDPRRADGGAGLDPDQRPARLHYLPRSAMALMSGNGGAVREPLMLLQQLLARLEFRKLMLLSPYADLGDGKDDLERRLRGLLARFDDAQSAADETVLAPLVVWRPPPGLVDPGQPREEGAKEEGTNDESPSEDAPSVLAHGFAAREAVGGRAVLAPRFVGRDATDQRVVRWTRCATARVCPRVATPSSVAAVLSRRAIERGLPSALKAAPHVPHARGASAADAADGPVQRPPHGGPFQGYATVHAQIDAALALLDLREARAVGDSVLMVAAGADAGGDGPEGTDTAAAAYFREMDGVARGGQPVPPDVLAAPALYAGINAVADPVVTAARPLLAAARREHPGDDVGHVTLWWDLYCSCTGINVEGINLLVPLEPMLQIRAVAAPDCWCEGQPCEDRQALARLALPKMGTGDERYDHRPAPAGEGDEDEDGGKEVERKAIWVSHKPVDALATFPYKGAARLRHRPAFVVSRTMLEVDRIPAAWVAALNDDAQVDEVWVPSSFLVDAFCRSGVKDTRPIHVVPEAVDTDAFDPARVAPHPDIATGGCAECYRLLSVFKWEHRKGWDVLLRAYIGEFRPEDPVELHLVTYLYMDPDPRSEGRIRDKIHAWARRHLHREPESLPRIRIHPRLYLGREMPRLFRAAHCFVLPTRGEGWGLPLHEAMAMGLPAIGTRWGGNLDFMNATNSMLLDIDGLEAPQDGFARYPRHSKSAARGADEPHHAVPSASHLRELLRWALDHQEEAAAIGAVARRHIVKHFSRPAVAAIVRDRVVDISKRL